MKEIKPGSNKVLPWYHQCHTDCLKNRILEDPLTYPWNKWDKDPVSQLSELNLWLVTNLFSHDNTERNIENKVFLQKYKEIKKLKEEEKRIEREKYCESQ